MLEKKWPINREVVTASVISRIVNGVTEESSTNKIFRFERPWVVSSMVCIWFRKRASMPAAYVSGWHRYISRVRSLGAEAANNGNKSKSAMGAGKDATLGCAS